MVDDIALLFSHTHACNKGRGNGSMYDQRPIMNATNTERPGAKTQGIQLEGRGRKLLLLLLSL